MAFLSGNGYFLSSSEADLQQFTFLVTVLEFDDADKNNFVETCEFTIQREQSRALRI